jgi:hypothetical protein
VDDQQLWESGTRRLATMLAALPSETRTALSHLVSRYRQLKEELIACSAEYDAAAVCRECRGQCCLNGKYRLSSLDYLACLVEKVSPVVDFTQKPLCPYGGEDGCFMAPGVRPADCVLFVCDLIDVKLAPQARQKLAELERQVRTHIADASRLVGEELGTPLLLWAEKN